MVLRLDRVYLEILPAGASGCPPTVSHAESASQHHLRFKDLLSILAIWTQIHIADGDGIANYIACAATSFPSAIGQLLFLDNKLSFLETWLFPLKILSLNSLKISYYM